MLNLNLASWSNLFWAWRDSFKLFTEQEWKSFPSLSTETIDSCWTLCLQHILSINFEKYSYLNFQKLRKIQGVIELLKFVVRFWPHWRPPEGIQFHWRGLKNRLLKFKTLRRGIYIPLERFRYLSKGFIIPLEGFRYPS